MNSRLLMSGAPERAGRFGEKGATSKTRRRRKTIDETRTRQPDACYADHCSSGVLYHTISRSCGTSCVNGRAHATARRRFLSHFPGDHEHAWARSRKTEPRPRRENEAGARCVRCLPHAGGETVRLCVGEPLPPARPAGPACRRQRGRQPCRRPCEPAASARESKERVAWPGEWTSSVSRAPMASARASPTGSVWLMASVWSTGSVWLTASAWASPRG